MPPPSLFPPRTVFFHKKTAEQAFRMVQRLLVDDKTLKHLKEKVRYEKPVIQRERIEVK
jgi:hypothetical protein